MKKSNNSCRLNEATKRRIERSLDDARAGRTLSMEEVQRRLKIRYRHEEA
ncbi:MAG: hypothetical protein ACRD5H_02740 [Nitrososphaerales archaeon]